VVVAEFAEILRESYWAQGSSFSEILEEAQRISWYLDDSAETRALIEIVQQAEALARE